MATKNGTNYNDNGTIQNNVYYPILTGTDGDDNIYGLAGNDIINGGAGNDNLYGDAGNDLLRGGDGNDYLSGGYGNDTLIGDRGADRFLGGAGNDLLIWNNGDGSDRISGETGYDTVQVNGAPVGDNFRLQRDAQGKAIFDRLNLVPFTLTVDTAEKFEINGLGGDDILDVNSLAGTGVSLVQFTGGAGNDLLDGSGTETSLLGYGNDGNDTLIGGAGIDSLYGDAGNDLLRGGDGNDYLSGGYGNDTLIGDRGADRFLGGAGNDLLIWNNGDGSDRISGETGYDTVQVNGAPVGDNFRLQGDAQGKAIFDRLNLVPFTLTVDTAEKFEINGQGGDDILDVNSLAGTGVSLVQFTGGAGNDTLDGSGSSTQLYGNGDAGNDVLIGSSANDTLNGGDGNDLVEGEKGNDTMIGGAGNDTLAWDDGDGSDRISGNAGIDTIDVDGSVAQGDKFVLGQQGNLAIFDRVNLGQFKLTVDTAEQFSVSGEGGNDSFDVNNLSYTGVNLVSFSGGAGNDTLDGSDSTTKLYGNGDAGNDVLIGSSANDTLYGGDGNDLVEGEKGNDTMIGGAGNDTLAWDDGDGSDRISGNAGIDTVDVDGSVAQGDKFVLGQQGNLAIFDRVNLGQFKLTVDTAEQFSVSGEGGNDSFDVNNLSYTGVNLVSFSGGAGNDTLDGSDSTTRLYGNGDAGDDLLIGGSRHDTLYGGAGKDTLYGGAGNDYIVGGYGADVLYGDGGADKFAFNYVSEGIDIIKDFQKNWSQPSLGDKIEISKVGFGASSTNQFKYDSYTGALSFLGTQFATIENKPAGFSTTTDIVLV